jgi:TonB family protein
MKTQLVYGSMTFAVLCLFCSTSLCASQGTEAKNAQSTAAQAYPNNADGLHSLLAELLQTAKNDEQLKLGSMIAEMKIPNYENWSASTFGQEGGAKFADMYGKYLQASELQFAMLWNELAKQAGDIAIQKTDTAKRYGVLTGPLDEYTASWKKTDASAGPDTQPIGSFYFVSGKFRFNGALHEIRVLSAHKPGPVAPAKLINQVQPVYPEDARKLRIQGTVAINVIIQKDGTVTVQNVGAGPALLAPAALTAVQQWRYDPAKVNGEPVDVQTKLLVTFALSSSQNVDK